MSFLRYLSLVRSALPQLLPLMRDARVPQWLKTSTIVSALLIISPLDIFGDIPVLGIFDDASLLAILMTAFVHFATNMRSRREEKEMRIVTPTQLPPSNA